LTVDTTTSFSLRFRWPRTTTLPKSESSGEQFWKMLWFAKDCNAGKKKKKKKKKKRREEEKKKRRRKEEKKKNF